MKAAGFVIVAGYVGLVLVIGPWGLAAAGAHLGLQILATQRRKG